MLKNSFLHHFLDSTFYKYALIGVSGVVLDFILYTVLVQLGMSPIIASVISVSAGIINNFFLNAYLNFKKTSNLGRRFISFYLIGFTGVIISVLFIFVLHNIFGLHPLVAKLLSIVPIIIFQFLFNKSISFSDNPSIIPWKALTLFAVSVVTITGFIFNAPYYDFTDEADNLLGGQFIANGSGILYIDYFSHHMPLPYFIVAPLFVILGTKLVAIKVAFGIIMSLWLLAMSRHLYRAFGLVSFISFTLLIAFTQVLSWSHMLLGETLAGFAIVHALILLITARARRPAWPDIVTYSVLAGIVSMSVLSYLPIVAVIYAIALWTIYYYILDKKNPLSLRNFTKMLIAGFIVATPYIVFFIYLVLTHSFAEFKEQAISFNSLYYSQYTTDAPTSKIDALLSIGQGISHSFYSVLGFQPVVKVPIIAWTFCIAVFVSLFLIFNRGLKAIAGVALFMFMLSASREGPITLFSNSDTVRSSIIITLVGVLIISVALALIDKKSLRKDITQRLSVGVIAVFAALVLLLGISTMSTIARDYLRGKATVDTRLEPGSPATVINLINTDTDYYWIGPIDFSSQLKISSKFASNHRFYAPWHSKCQTCSDDLLGDLERNRPKVIALGKNVSIWGNKPKDYAVTLIKYIDRNYYQLSDPALANFYFSNEHATTINKILGAKGYEISKK